jgi:hypothetical protein
VNLTPGQLDRISDLGDQWSFLWDKTRAMWIAAEDCPDGEQIEEANLDALLARLPMPEVSRSEVVCPTGRVRVEVTSRPRLLP